MLSRLLRADLNLLPVLMVLIETESTQATADRIGRTQSAVSHSLGRLREMLGDELFVRHGPRLIATPFVHQLNEPLQRLMQDTRNLIDHSQPFDPERSDRLIVLGGPNVALPLLQSIADRIRQQAPSTRIRLTDHRQGDQRLFSGQLDLLVTFYRNKPRPGQSMEIVGQATWCVFAAPEVNLPDHPSGADWAAHPHVQVYTGPEGRSPIEDAATLAGIARSTPLQVSGFLEALHFARSSNMLFTNFRELVSPPAKALGLRSYDLPFDVPSAPVVIVTRQTKHSAMSRWLFGIATRSAKTYFSTAH